MHLQRAQRWGWTLSWNLIPTTTILYTTLHNETTTRIFFLVGRRRRWYVYFHVFCSVFPICAGPGAALPVPAPRAARKKEKGFLQPERDIENAITRMGKGFGSFLWVDWRRLYISGKKRRMRCTGCLCTWQFGPRREEGFAALWIFRNDLYRGRSWARIVFFFFTTLMHFLDMCLFDTFLVGQVYSACRAQGALDYSRRERKWWQIYFLDAEMPVVRFQTTKSWNWDSYLFQFLLSKQTKMWTMLHFNLNHNCLSWVGAFSISDFFL